MAEIVGIDGGKKRKPKEPDHPTSQRTCSDCEFPFFRWETSDHNERCHVLICAGCARPYGMIGDEDES